MKQLWRRTVLPREFILPDLGIPFLQAGEEAARTKYGDDNSYRSEAKVNQLELEPDA